MKNNTCYICKKLLGKSGFSHVSNCNKKLPCPKSLESNKINHLKHCFGIGKVKLKRCLLVGQSVKDIRKLFYGVDSKSLYFAIKYYDLQRTSKEVAKVKKINYTKTCVERYGVESANKLNTVKNKKKKSCLEKYGVENVAKVKEFSLRALNTKKARNNGQMPNIFSNKTKEEKNRILSYAWNGTKKKWNNYSDNERKKAVEQLVNSRKNWYKNLTLEQKTKIIESRNSNFQSKLELKVFETLKANGIAVEKQKWVNRKSYDFKISGTNVLIEVQGNYWHCNPKIYESNTLVSFPNKKN